MKVNAEPVGIRHRHVDIDWKPNIDIVNRILGQGFSYVYFHELRHSISHHFKRVDNMG